MMRRGYVCVGFLAMCLFCVSAHASVIMSHASNGAYLYDRVDVGFLSQDSGAVDRGTDISRLHALASAGPGTLLSRAEKTIFPASSIDVYDIAHGISRTYYTFDPSPNTTLNDKITLSVSANCGAHDAHNRAGEPCSAEFRAISSFSFDVDIPPSAAGHPIGYLYVEPLPLADMYSTYIQVAIFEDGNLVKSRRAGGAAMKVPLMYNSSYELRLLYEGSVAFSDCKGLHPDYVPEADAHSMAYNVSATIVHAPEPASLLALVGGGLVLALRPRHRRA